MSCRLDWLVLMIVMCFMGMFLVGCVMVGMVVGSSGDVVWLFCELWNCWYCLFGVYCGIVVVYCVVGVCYEVCCVVV